MRMLQLVPPHYLDPSSVLPPHMSAQYWGIRCVGFILAVWAASFVIGFQLGIIIFAVSCVMSLGFGLLFRQPILGMYAVTIMSVA
ncbi:MAG: hypothetical protein AAF485_29400, partial [Chloroflexota bacterium]